MACNHPNMGGGARCDYCPDCGYTFYYGDALAEGDARQSRLIDAGDDDSPDTRQRLAGEAE